MSIFSKIREVFTKEYMDEIEYRECLEKNIDKFKLKSNNFDLSERIDILRARNFKSNFQISLEGKNELVSVFHSEEQERQFSKIANERMNKEARLESKDIEK